MATVAKDDWRTTVRQGVERTAGWTTGAALIALALLMALALGSYRGTDPAFNTAAAGPPANLLGWPGAYLADTLLTLAGPLVAMVVPLTLLLGVRLWRGEPLEGARSSWIAGALAVAAGAIALSLWRADTIAALPGGAGGAVGLMGASLIDWATGFAGDAVRPWLRWGAILALGIAAIGLALSALSIARPRLSALCERLDAVPRLAFIDRTEDAEEDEPAAQPEAKRPRLPVLPRKSKPKIADRTDAPAPAAQPRRQEQLDLRDDYQLPSLDLLTEAPPPVGAALDKAGAGEERPPARIRARRLQG